MNTETMITELNAVAEKHKNDKLLTFQTDITAMCRDIIPKLEQLVEYEAIGTVEECRELLKLPCAVGDVVYTNYSMQGWYFRKENRPYKAEVTFVGINGVDNYINVCFENGYMLQFKFSDIGKNVFLTKSEAEQALKEMEWKK